MMNHYNRTNEPSRMPLSRIPVSIRNRHPQQRNIIHQTPLERLRDDFHRRLEQEKEEKLRLYSEQRHYQSQAARRHPEIMLALENNNDTFVRPHYLHDEKLQDDNGNNMKYLDRIRYNDRHLKANRAWENEMDSGAIVGQTRHLSSANRQHSAQKNYHPQQALPSTQARASPFQNKLANPEANPHFGNTYTVALAKKIEADNDLLKDLPGPLLVRRKAARVIRPIQTFNAWQPDSHDDASDDDEFLNDEAKKRLEQLKRKQQLANQRWNQNIEARSRRPAKVTIRNVANQHLDDGAEKYKPVTFNKESGLTETQNERNVDGDNYSRAEKLEVKKNALANEYERDASTANLMKRKISANVDDVSKLEKKSPAVREVSFATNEEQDGQRIHEISVRAKSRLNSATHRKTNTSNQPFLPAINQQRVRPAAGASEVTLPSESDRDAQIRLQKQKILERQRLLVHHDSDDDSEEMELRRKEKKLEQLIQQQAEELEKMRRENSSRMNRVALKNGIR